MTPESFAPNRIFVVPGCASKLLSAGLLASAMKYSRAKDKFELNLGVPISTIQEIEQTLRSNGVLGVLRSASVSRSGLENVAARLRIASLLQSIKSTLKVDLLNVRESSRLSTELQSIVSSLKINAPLHPFLPTDNIALLGLTKVGFASMQLRGLKIDLFGSIGKKDLVNFLSNPSTSMILSQFGRPPLQASTLDSLSLVLAAHGLQNSNPTDTSIPPTLSVLKDPAVSSFLDGVSSGRLANGFQLPEESKIAALNIQKSCLRMMEKITGLKSKDPAFSGKLTNQWSNFRSNDICALLHSSPLPAAPPIGLCTLTLLSSATVRLGNLFKPDAGQKLAKTVAGLHEDTFRKNGAASDDWKSLISPLERLARIGAATTPELE